MNYASQLRAAQRAHDNACEPDQPDNEQAIVAYAAQLVSEDEIEALVLELYEASSAILVALAERQKATGRAPIPSTVTFMQRLRRLVQSVEAA